jgi:hypothetical protein
MMSGVYLYYDNALKLATTATGIDVTGTVAAGAGTALLPSITTTGDLNTGMWFPAADTIAFSEGGVEALRIDSSGNVGIGTSSPGNVGIGETAPDTSLHVTTPSGTKTELNLSQTAVTNFRLSIPASTDALTFVYGSSAERMRIDCQRESVGGDYIYNSIPSLKWNRRRYYVCWHSYGRRYSRSWPV